VPDGPPYTAASMTHLCERLCEKSIVSERFRGDTRLDVPYEGVKNLPHPPRQGWNVYRSGRYWDPHPGRGAMSYFRIGLIRSGLRGFPKRKIGHCTPVGVPAALTPLL
jgi:hypothetical protein